MADLKPKRIVINNAKKSTMACIGGARSSFFSARSNDQDFHSMTNTGPVAESIAVIPSNLSNEAVNR